MTGGYSTAEVIKMYELIIFLIAVVIALTISVFLDKNNNSICLMEKSKKDKSCEYCINKEKCRR